MAPRSRLFAHTPSCGCARAPSLFLYPLLFVPEAAVFAAAPLCSQPGRLPLPELGAVRSWAPPARAWRGCKVAPMGAEATQRLKPGPSRCPGLGDKPWTLRHVPSPGRSKTTSPSPTDTNPPCEVPGSSAQQLRPQPGPARLCLWPGHQQPPGRQWLPWQHIVMSGVPVCPGHCPVRGSWGRSTQGQGSSVPGGHECRALCPQSVSVSQRRSPRPSPWCFLTGSENTSSGGTPGSPGPTFLGRTTV